MYKLSVPIYNRTVTPAMRETVLRQVKEAKVDRIFLIPLISVSDGSVPDYDSLCENIAFFQNEGYEVGIWVGHTIGHGSPLGDVAGEEDTGITPLRNFAGRDIPDTRCPFDKKMQAGIAVLMENLARSGASIILIDDDFRISQHGSHFCCVCDLHMARISELLGEEISREELCTRIFAGGPNRYRDAYLQAEGEALLELARVMREAVDKVDTKVGISLCSAHAQWDIDGADPLMITEIFQGDRAPLLRTHGAPYWVGGNTFSDVLEQSRMFVSFADEYGIETMTECDTYPRPRYRTPASFMELHDALMRADRVADGALKYMFDYVSDPHYETGYLRAHCRDLPLLERLETLFEDGRQTGVRICLAPHLLKDSDCDLVAAHDKSPYPSAGVLLASNSIPTTYTEEGICRAVFGNNVRELGNDLSGGLILDAAAAILLTESGADVGLGVRASRKDLREAEPTYLHTKEDSALITSTHCKLLDATVNPNAEILLWVEVDGRRVPLLYRYCNQRGERFLVFMYVGGSEQHNSGLIQGYYVQKALTEGIEWLTGKHLPIWCEGNPELYILCREGEDFLTVGLFNCFADPIDMPLLTTEKAYTSIECVGCSGTVEGNTVTLSSIPAFSFAAFKVKK